MRLSVHEQTAHGLVDDRRDDSHVQHVFDLRRVLELLSAVHIVVVLCSQILLSECLSDHVSTDAHVLREFRHGQLAHEASLAVVTAVPFDAFGCLRTQN